MWALHLSTLVDESDGVALKKPTVHGLHVGGRDADPATDVNLPASHFVCAVHTAFVSADLLVGALARKKPLAQALHCVSRVAVPADTVHSPCEQVLWIPEHATVSDASFALFLGAATRNLPFPQALHTVLVLQVPALDVH